MREDLICRSKDPLERASLERFLDRSTYLDAAELFHHRVGRDEYVSFLRREFEVPGTCELPEVHRALVRLPVSHLFTTNYDTLIERAFQRAKRPLHVTRHISGYAAGGAAPGTPHLVKLHGSIERPDSMIFTRSQFVHARRTRVSLLARSPSITASAPSSSLDSTSTIPT